MGRPRVRNTTWLVFNGGEQGLESTELLLQGVELGLLLNDDLVQVVDRSILIEKFLFKLLEPKVKIPVVGIFVWEFFVAHTKT